MKSAGYRSVTLGGENILVNSASVESLKKVGAVVFDCDGVLVDTRQSYDLTIMRVTERMVYDIAGVHLTLGTVGPELIIKLRRTGGFNNDWDTTFALTVFSLLTLDGSLPRRNNAGRAQRGERIGKVPLAKTFSRLTKITDRFCVVAKGIGYSAVSIFLENEALTPSQRLTAARAQEHLGYPGSPPRCKMATLFDEMYHGPALFRKMYGIPPRYYTGRGMIERERLLVSRGVFDRLEKILGGRKIAIATGRPFVATKHSLRHLMSYFDRKASTYIGDADVDPSLAEAYEKFRKPRGGSLVRAREAFASDGMLYVGDSAEDQMMVRDANRTVDDILFGAISGTSSDEDGQVKYFKENGADLVMRSVEQVPLVLEAFRR